MTALIVRATAVGWSDPAFPGWLDVTTVDGSGRVHRIVEKAPVLTELAVDQTSVFPFQLWLRGEHLRMNGTSVVVRLGHGVETTDGLRELTFGAADVRWR
jgi:hypothetical protein